MTAADVCFNLNSFHSKMHLNDDNGPKKPIVCILCDCFIVSDSNKYVSLETLNTHQELFYADEQFKLSDELKNCYQIDFPENVIIPRELRNSLQITNCLLSPRSTYVVSDSGNNGFNICDKCSYAVARGKRPKFCIASNYCFGTAPSCLTELTEVELALITPIKTFGYCFCYTGGQKHVLKGSLAYYKVDKDFVIRSMLNLAATKANIVIVIYGKITQKQYSVARQKNKIRVEKIKNAIQWLLDNNSEWKSSADEIGNLDDFINRLQNPRIVTVCEIENDDDIAIESNETYNIFYPDGSVSVNNGGQEDIDKLTELVYMATTEKDDPELHVELQKDSVYEYKDSNLVNACILQFPYGRGGMHDERLLPNGNITTSVDIEKYIEYLSMISIPHFQEGLFTLILYNMMMKQSMFRTASWLVRHKINNRILASELTMEDVDSAIDNSRAGRGIPIDDQAAINSNQLLRHVDAVANTAAHSNEAAKKAKQKAKAIQHKFGCPTFFLTVTPDDDNSFTVQVLSGNIIDKPNETVATSNDDKLIDRSKKRTALRLKYPGICAIYFELALKAVIKEVLGWNTEKQKQETNGLFGPIDAFTCSIEEQGRGTLHAHFLIWISSINKKREDLHNPLKRVEAARIIKEMIDNITSTKCFFNDSQYLVSGRNNFRRKRFLHQCNNNNYGSPIYPNDEQLLKLRCENCIEEKLISCGSCMHTWSYDELQDSYLKDFIGVPYFSSFTNENRVKRLKALAVEFQSNSREDNIKHYAIDFGYNSHRHCTSCFKHGKNSKKKIFDITATSCRYRYPQRKKEKTIIQNVSPAKLPWYSWNGSNEKRHIKEISLERCEYDAFQNNYCPAISYSKFACNTNLAFLTTGPIGEYCFNYCVKGTQYEDTEPYEKLKSALGRIFSVVKHQHDDRMEAQRKLLAASFIHQSSNTIGPAMAAYLTRNKSRFIFSHEFVDCPIRDLRSLTQGEEINVTISFNNCNPHFHCYAMHYLCRPISLEDINAYEFFSKYEVVKCTEKVLNNGGMRLITAGEFIHPSYNHKSQLCEQAVIKRKKPFLVKIFQFDFIDTANFENNILLETTPITEEMESYCQLVLLLFTPFRCDANLKIDGKYTNCLRQAVATGTITSEYKQFLQNIQDSKGNSFRFKITNDDLDRAAELLHDPRHEDHAIGEINDEFEPEVFLHNDQQLQSDLIEYLISDMTDNNDNFDIHNNNNVKFNLNILRAKGGKNASTKYLPSVLAPGVGEDLNVSGHNFIETANDDVDITNPPNTAVNLIKMEKNKMALKMRDRNLIHLSLKDIIGTDVEVDVLPANGTSASITDWAIKCNLDPCQQRAFEIITGYYILSYIYSIPFLDDSRDSDSRRIRQEKNSLERLVRRDQINSNQLICFLHGPGGSGKTTVISMLQIYSKKYHFSLDNDEYNRSIVLTAMTGVAATLIGGETAHSALKLNNKANQNITHENVELWTNTKIIVIDEISFAGNNIIQKINTRLCQLKNSSQQIFGGIHVIFCGDLRQLEPVEGLALYKFHNKQQCELKSHVNCYIELSGRHRFSQDPEWGEILMRFREGKPTNEDIAIINSREVTGNNIEMPHNIKYATFHNKDRDSINTAIFQKRIEYWNEKYHNTNSFVIIFSDKIKIKKYDKFIPFLHHKLFYEHCGESDVDTGRQGRFDPVLKLYEGCEVMLTENIDVINGLANGTQALVRKIVLNQGSSYSRIKLQNNIKVKAVNASDVKYVLLQHKNANISQQLFKIKPKQVSFKAVFPAPHHLHFGKNTPKVTMQAKQIRIIVNNATTGHKLQGTGVDNLFVHSWQYKKNWPYVVLSRVKQLSGLYLRTKIKSQLSEYKMNRELASLLQYFQTMLPLPAQN